MTKTVIAALALGALAPCLGAQEAGSSPAPKAEAKAPRIAVIDMARVSSESLLGKGYQAQLESLKAEIDAYICARRALGASPTPRRLPPTSADANAHSAARPCWSASSWVWGRRPPPARAAR